MENNNLKKEKNKRIWQFLINDVWDIELTSISAIRRFMVKTLRVILLIIKGFRDDECSLHASALTFSTLMAIVPILALSLALARGLGDTKTTKNKIRSMVSEWTQNFGSESIAITIPGSSIFSNKSNNISHTQNNSTRDELTPEELAGQVNHMVDQAFEKVENISFAALGSVGLGFLLWMVITVLGRVEDSFNKVWGITIKRTIFRRCTDYLSAVLILPFLIIAASSLPVVDFTTRFLDESTANMIRDILGSGLLKNITVIIMTSLCFTFLIMFMPNTRVKYLPGLTGGTVSGLLFIAWMWLCAGIQIFVARYGKIYGSFAIVPIVLAWVYVSWEIVLFGAEVAFAVQNCSTFRMEQGSRKASIYSRLILALSIVLEASRAMIGKGNNFETAVYARKKHIPVRFLNDVIDELVQAEFMAELSENNGCFVLLKAPDTIIIKDIVDIIIKSGVKPEALGLGSIDTEIKNIVHKFVENSDKLTTIQSLLTPGSQGRLVK